MVSTFVYLLFNCKLSFISSITASLQFFEKSKTNITFSKLTPLVSTPLSLSPRPLPSTPLEERKLPVAEQNQAGH